MATNNLHKRIEELQKRFKLIPAERKNILDSFAKYISNKVVSDQKVNLIFICTHNSRRSHMTQIWAQAAAEFYGIPNVRCYSGGTETTAFYPSAITAVKSAGFKVEKIDDSDNPVYLVYYSDEKDPMKCFSKVYSDSFNPQKDFAAIMTCSSADANCPVVFGADARFPIRYDDPKEFDGTREESAKYIERFEQIGIEMLFAFSLVVAV